MSIEIKVPVLPESVEDATIAAWHKKPGDIVRRDENLVDLETDKVVLEVPAPADGKLASIDAQPGETVTSDQLLATLEEVTGDLPESEQDEVAAGQDEPDSDGGDAADEGAAETGKADDAGEAPAAPPTATPEPTGSERRSASPSARRVATEESVDLDDVTGTGRGGRITKGDVLTFLKGGGSARPEERVKMSRLRGVIARRMKEAQNTAAILTSFNEVDLKAVMDLRRRYKQEFVDTHGIKLGLMSFFVRACVEALKQFPVVNASIEGDEIVYHGYQDIGIAVSTERGLMVPIIRDAGTLGLADIERAIAHYAGSARDGSIAIEDLQGGTFSITNGGVFGSLLSTPLLNPPQSAILGMHNILERPVVVDGEIVVRPMMYVALSYDHRLIDGKDSVRFLVAVKNALEDPARMLLNV